jgi:BirA family biotin operon repressor/biotin-[acetyl-CoA-carboxylase] ligase
MTHVDGGMIDLCAEKIHKEIQHELRAVRYGSAVHVLTSTPSTNDLALSRLDSLPSGVVFVADRQTHGRGSHGRSWSSPAGTDLYFSVCDRLPVPAERLAQVALVTGLAIAESVDSWLRRCLSDLNRPALETSHVQLKWPNDVLARGRKCAGVLVETRASGRHPSGEHAVVIGVGINVRRTEWPSDLASNATSMRRELEAAGADLAGDDSTPHRGQVLAHVLAHLERRIDEWVAAGLTPLQPLIRDRLAYLGQPVECGDLVGTLEGIDADGFARVATRQGLRRALCGPLRPR